MSESAFPGLDKDAVRFSIYPTNREIRDYQLQVGQSSPLHAFNHTVIILICIICRSARLRYFRIRLFVSLQASSIL
jgi:hypothetical protein